MRAGFSYAVAGILIVVGLVAGCPQQRESGPEVVLGTSTLLVVETSPPADASDVPSTSSIVVRVSGPLNPDSVVNPNTNTPTGALLLKDDGGGNVNGVVTYNADAFALTFTPSEALT